MKVLTRKEAEKRLLEETDAKELMIIVTHTRALTLISIFDSIGNKKSQQIQAKVMKYWNENEYEADKIFNHRCTHEEKGINV